MTESLDEIEVTDKDSLAVALATEQLSAIAVAGDAAWLRHVLEAFAARPRGATHLALHRLELRDNEAIASDVLRRALPRLAYLEVQGARVLGDVVHPGVRVLRMTGAHAVHSVRGDGAPWASVKLLDLAFEDRERDRAPVRERWRDEPWYDKHYEERYLAGAARALSAARLPALRAIDLSRNEPGWTLPHHLGGERDPFRFLAGLALRDQLVRVRMPSLRTAAQAQQLTAAIAAMPALRELSLARQYATSAVEVPAPAVASAVWPWPPADESPPALYGRIEHAASRYARPSSALALPLPPLIHCLEAVFEDALIAPAPWSELFERLHAQRTHAVPRHALLAMLSELAPLEPALVEWDRVRHQLAQLDASARLVLSLDRA